MRFLALDKLINLHDGYRREFKIDAHRLLLLQVEGERYLIEGLCPHQEHPLSEGWIEGDCIACPLHGYKFSLPTGQLIHSTEEECRSLRTYTIEYEGADLGVLWDD